MRSRVSALEEARAARLWFSSLQTASFPSATLAEFYRLALLLTGSIKAAQQVMAGTLAAAEGEVSQMRNPASRVAWLVNSIRERCMTNNESAPPPSPRLVRDGTATGGPPRVLKIEAFLLAQRFHALPEPERSALALFYLDLFTIEEIALLLKMNMEVLGETLSAARGLLEESLRDAQDAGDETP
jgi:DNA-directed RNA polymerase specialized sigma24 family protein